MFKMKDKFYDFLLNVTSLSRVITFIIIGVLIPFTYFIVYVTGGIQYVYSHTMYVAIVIAGFKFGIIGGVSVAVIGGLVLGPYMPVNTDTMEMQNTINWIFRLIMFTLIGYMTGLFSERYKHHVDQIVTLLTTDHQTDIPLFKQLYYDNKIQIKSDEALIMIRVLNQQTIIDSINDEIYQKALRQIYATYQDQLETDGRLYMLDFKRLILIVKKDQVSEVMLRLEHWLIEPIFAGQVPLHIDVVMGILTKPTNNLLEIINHLNDATLVALNSHQTSVYCDEMRRSDKPDIRLLGEFSKALNDGNLRIVIQPIIDTQTEEIVSFEVLSRWRNPEYGEISPNQFIPLIINTNLIQLLTKYVIQQTLDVKVKFDKLLPNVKYSLNVTSRCIYNSKSLDNIIESLANQGIELELTEELMMERKYTIPLALKRLNDNQISVNIDDFGTGYSTLRYLSDFSFQQIKIDLSFIDKLHKSKEKQAVVKFIIDLANSIGKTVVAEGVEEKAVFTLLKEMKCDFVQGYYFSKPLEISDVEDFVKTYNKQKNG